MINHVWSIINLKMRSWLIGVLCTPFFMLAQVPVDKQQHFYVGGAISSMTYGVVYSVSNNRNKAIWYGVASSFVIGLGKEIMDRRDPYNRFDGGDLTATLVGGVMFTKTMDIVSNRKKRKCGQRGVKCE